MSFRAYYTMVYRTAVENQAQYNDAEPFNRRAHVISLLRACFVIALVYDRRIERFLMAQHSIHLDYTQTKPPDRAQALRFLEVVRPVVDAYLFDGGIEVPTQMIEIAIKLWVETCMI